MRVAGNSVREVAQKCASISGTVPLFQECLPCITRNLHEILHSLQARLDPVLDEHLG